MISRAGTGRPWLYQDLLGVPDARPYVPSQNNTYVPQRREAESLEPGSSRPERDVKSLNRDTTLFQSNMSDCVDYYMLHLQGLAQLQNEHQAVLQSKTLVRYYFKPWLSRDQLQMYYTLDDLSKIEQYLRISSRAYDGS